MIERQTVFILGAGAHCSYGFPSGYRLKADVVAKTRQANSEEYSTFAHLVAGGYATQNEVDTKNCNAFAEALENAGQPSIDAFLNANRHMPGFEKIGKAGIAQVLLDYEASAGESEDDWLSYLFEQMMSGVDSPESFIKGNKVGFITFNYDRFLESWLHKKIRYSFGLDEENALMVLRQIPIHHVYGSLGPYPTSEGSSPQVWVDAASSIKTIYDSLHDGGVIDAAQALISEAQAVCLLGFGFHMENINILRLSELLTIKKNVYVSRFELNDIEFQRAIRPFNGRSIASASEHHKCLRCLRRATFF